MKKFFVFFIFLAGGMVCLFLGVSCNTSNPSAPNFQAPIQTVVALNPTATGTPTYTYTSTPTVTATVTITLTPTPYPTYSWSGILTFKNPAGIAVDNSSSCNGVSGPCVYVADTGNNRVEKYAS